MRDKLIEILKYRRHLETSELADVLLENGVIVPPCKVGDTVFCLSSPCLESTKIIEVLVESVEIHKDYILICGACGEWSYQYFDREIGKTVFFNKEEAEAALKGGEE